MQYDWKTANHHLVGIEPRFQPIIQQLKGRILEIQPFPSLFYALSRSIIYQQLSVRAANTIFQRYLDLFPNKRAITAKNIDLISDQTLRSAGLSRPKLSYLRHLAEAQKMGHLPSKPQLNTMSDQAIIDALTPIKGIGVWTVHMLLIFHLGRPDIMPSLDLAVQKGYALILGDENKPTPKQLEKLTEHWGPYRSVGSWYCWRAVELSWKKNVNQ